MTTWASTDFTAGAVGTAVTTATEPLFTTKVGTLNYGPQVGSLAGQSVEHGSGSGAMNLDLAGKTHVRLAFDVLRVSGTQSAGLAAMAFRNGATTVADLFLRNQNGGQWALRGTTASASAYVGQTTSVHDEGEVYHLEVEWTSGVGLRLDVWAPGNATATPSESFTSAMTNPVTVVGLFNTTGTTGLTMRYAGFRATDGEQVRQGVTVGSFVHNLGGLPAHDRVRAVAKTSGATSVRMFASLTSDMANPIYGAAVAPAATGYSKHEVTGLAPSTPYFWGIEVDGVKNTTHTGKATTLPEPGSHADFTFWSGSCHDSPGSSVFGFIQARNPLFGVQLGDMGYPYITGGIGTGPNANIAPEDAATVRANRELTIQAANPNALYRNIPFSHTYSDCDGPGGNGDGTWPGLVSGGVQSAYREQFNHGTLPLSDCGARSWVVGRVRCIHTDELTLASSRDLPDNSSKTKLGASQKAWFKTELQAAKDAGQVVFWFGDGIWMNGATTGTDNTWGRYVTERNEVGAFIDNLGVKIIRIHGDSHTLFADDGTNNPSGSFPQISAAPMHTTAHASGFTFTNGSWPTVSTNSSRQYGFYEVEDTDGQLTLTFHGIASTVASPTEVERVTMETIWNMNETFDNLYVGGVQAVKMYVGGEQVWP